MCAHQVSDEGEAFAEFQGQAPSLAQPQPLSASASLSAALVASGGPWAQLASECCMGTKVIYIPCYSRRLAGSQGYVYVCVADGVEAEFSSCNYFLLVFLDRVDCPTPWHIREKTAGRA